MRRVQVLLIAAAVLTAALIGAGEQPTPFTYTAEQAAAGRTVYMNSCAGCHLPDLGGRNEASPLAGPNFMTVWRNRTPRELHDYIAKAMPPGQTLSSEAYHAVTAFILHTNGISAPASARENTSELRRDKSACASRWRA